MNASLSQLPDFNDEELKQEPIERAETIPSSWYTSDVMLEFEKEAVFSSFWQLATHEDQLPNQGDMYTLQVADNPLLVVRDKEQKLNAFYNVCKHRGGPVAVKKGTTSVLQCRYHGWTYLLDGSLRGVPQFNKVDLFDKKDYGLEPVKLQSWEGLIFLSLKKSIADISDFLDGIRSRISPIDLSEFEFVKEQSYIIDCNWKVYVDNYLEGYHLPIVHPELSNLLDYREYTTDTFDWYSLQHSPFKTGENLYEAENGEAYYYFIFPNIMLNILPDRLQTNIVRPIDTDKTEVLFSYYYKNPHSEKMKRIIKEDIDYSHRIQLEDIEICELVQKGLRSRAYNKGRFSVERENGVYHFQALLKKTLRQARESYK